MDALIEPTPERIEKAGDCFEAQSVDRQMRTVKAARVLSRFEKFQPLTDEQRDAGMRFERNWELATRATVTASYGTRFAEGTPVSQLAEQASMEDSVKRVDWYGNHRRALDAIGPRGFEIISSFIYGETIEKIGRIALGRPCRKGTALHQGRAALWMVLDRLDAHYRPKKPPR